MILFLHNRYRTTGGEERTVEDLLWLVRERIGEQAELLSRDSATLGRRQAARGLLAGGLAPEEVAHAVRRTGARVVHAHNLNPTLGWKALAAARDAGARVVLHLHQYRLVCAIGVCHTNGSDCTRCHARNTLPGVRLKCRGNVTEALVYGGALALWQRRLIAQADAFVVPSLFARERLHALGVPLPWERVHVLAPPIRALASPPQRWGTPAAATPAAGTSAAGVSSELRDYALVAGRLAPEKGVDVAIAACRLAGLWLTVAGDGPERGTLEALAGDGDVRFVGHVADTELAGLRAGATVALAPSRSAETFGIAAAEALAAGLPVAGSRVGALTELLEEGALAAPDDAGALAEAIARLRADPGAGARGRQRAQAICSPEVIAPRLAELYERAAGK